ncbi:MAG: lipopolysaccharide heptosyltransferase II [Vicinamibacterales bacterium]
MTREPTAPGLLTPRRLVVRAPNWLGDAVMALPAMAALRRAWPETFLTVAAVPAVAPMFLEHTEVHPDAVVPVDKTNERAALTAGQFDTSVLFPNSFRAAWVAKQAGVTERWGYRAGARGWLLTRAVSRPRGPLHQADYYRHLVRALGVDVSDAPPSIRPAAETIARADQILRSRGVGPERVLVGMAPGAAYGHAKRWPPRRVAAVVQMLSADPGATCVLVGAAGDRDAGREIESALPSGVQVVDLIGRTDLRALVGVLGRCAAFVANDSGAMHLAAAAGVPVTAIFGPTNERATAPIGDHDVLIHPVFCRPCMLRDCPIDHRCMKGISAGLVADRVRARLARVE